MLREIKKEHKLNHDLYLRLVRALAYDQRHLGQSEFVSFSSSLPYKLQLELAMEVHRNLYETIDFLKNRDHSFIAWIGGALRHSWFS